MTRPDSTPASWREVAAQLTPEQSAQFELLDRSGDDPAALLAMARELVANDVTGVKSGEIAPPADAARLYGWQTYGERTWREFDGSTRQVGSAVIHVRGQQFSDGRCERWISVSASTDEEFQAEQARELAAALRAAADETERLA
jgi:preprotein translocase subunit SecD